MVLHPARTAAALSGYIVSWVQASYHTGISPKWDFVHGASVYLHNTTPKKKLKIILAHIPRSLLMGGVFVVLRKQGLVAPIGFANNEVFKV